MNRLQVFLLATLIAASPARGVDIIAYHATGTYGNVGYEATVVWGQGQYLLDMWSRLSTDQQNMAKSRQATEAAIEQRLEAVFLQSVVSLPLSSRESVGARIKNAPAVLSQLKRLVAGAVKTRSGLDSGMEDLRLRYAFPLYGEGGLLAVFAPSGKASPLDRYLGFVPAAAYTGVVIYVQGKHPAYGRDGVEATLKPCLFPRLYDPDMNLVLDATQTDRARLSSWGEVAYSNDLNEVPFLDRVGYSPLRIVARGVYGVADTDIVISREAARMLLSREENLKLLAEGRILVVLEAESAPEPPEAEAVDEDAPLEELGPEPVSSQKTTKAAASSSGH